MYIQSPTSEETLWHRSVDETIIIWNWKTDEIFRILEGHSNVNSIAHLGSDFLVAGFDDKTAKVWNWRTGEKLHTLEGHSGPVSSVAYLNSEFIVTGSHDQTFIVWDWQTGDIIYKFKGTS